jgi:ABC-type multidrug transport system ATPase subunit
MNRGKLLASGTAEQVRQILGSTERTITATLLNRHEEARAWLASQPSVHDPVADAPTVTFRFLGDDNAQADLMEGLIHLGIRIRSFEEKRTSFEDILVEVAESNRA